MLSIPFWWASVATGGRPLFLGLPVGALMLVLPLAVASSLALRDGGAEGLRSVWSGVVDPRRVDPRWWWLAGLGAAPSAAVLGWLVVPGPEGGEPGTAWYLAPVLFLVYLVGAVFEEVGWTGYLTTPLVARFGVLGAGLFIGVVWQAWHAVPFVSMGRSWQWIAGQAVLGVLIRILIVLAYARGGRSLALACAIHAMVNTTQMYPGGLLGWDPWPSVPGMLVVVVVAYALATRGRQSGQGVGRSSPVAWE